MLHSSRRLLPLCLALASVCGCAQVSPLERDTSKSPSQFFVPSGPVKTQAQEGKSPFVITGEMKARKWGLPDIIDLALKNNPLTSQAWQDARAAAARVGVSEAAYYPRVNLDASASHRYTRRTDTDITTRQSTLGPSLSLSWLVMDFGGREAATESAKYTLLAANYTQNRALQEVILATQRAYYQYQASKSLKDSALKSMERAEMALKVAKGRHEAGVATISDILSAQTSLSQAKLSLQNAEGAIQTTRGSLAVAMGFPANVDFDIDELPTDSPYEMISADVNSLIEEALKARPDLMAARSGAAALEEAHRKTKADALPYLNFNASTGMSEIDLNTGATSMTNNDRMETTFFAGFTVTFPLFTGYAQTFNEERTRAEALSAKERTRGAEQFAVNQVFTAYHALKTASQKVATSDDLLKSAARLEEVALGRYNEGVGTMLDLITAQSSLADARAQGINARWEWHTALALLAYSTGRAGLNGDNAAPKN